MDAESSLGDFNFTIESDDDFGEAVGILTCTATRTSPEPVFEWTFGIILQYRGAQNYEFSIAQDAQFCGALYKSNYIVMCSDTISFAGTSTQNINQSTISLEDQTNADFDSTKDWISEYNYVPMVCHVVYFGTLQHNLKYTTLQPSHNGATLRCQVTHPGYTNEDYQNGINVQERNITVNCESEYTFKI